MRNRRVLAPWILGFFLLACAGGPGTREEVAEHEDPINIYFRDGDLEVMTDQDLEVYIETEAGESEKLDRSFDDAPPQIPHTVDGMLPITSDDNECLECHHPDNVISKKDLPYPKTHVERPVMAAGGTDDAMVWVVKGYEETKDLVGTRYNCTMCHAPQATNVKTPYNDFGSIK